MSVLIRRRGGRLAIGCRLVGVMVLSAWLGWVVGAEAGWSAQPGQAKPAPAPAAVPGAAAAPLPATKAGEPPPAPARQFKTLPVDPQQDTPAVRRAVREILRSGALGDSQKQQLTAYYERFAFARWTRPDDYASIPAFRADLAADLRSAASGPVYDFLVGLTLAKMKEFIQPEYADVVRYNAMLVIGDLNVAERTKPLVPLPEAQAVLLAELNNPNQSDFVKVAVLIGLERHCAIGFPDQQVRNNQVFNPLLNLAQSAPPPGRSPEGHAWMRAKAIDALAALRYPGLNGALPAALANMVRTDDPKSMPPMVRIAAAKALGNLDYQQASGGIKPMDLATALAQMASDACGAEHKRAPLQMPVTGSSDLGRRGPPGFTGPSGRLPGPRLRPSPVGPGMENLPDDPEYVLQIRRRLKSQIRAVQVGLGDTRKGHETGVVGLVAGTPDEAFVKDVYKVVQDLMTKVLDDPNITLYELNKKVDDSKARLDELLSKARPAVTAAPAAVAAPAPKGGPPAAPAPAAPPAGAATEPAAPPPTP